MSRGAVSGAEPPRHSADGTAQGDAPRRLVPMDAVTGGLTWPGGPSGLPMESLVTATERARWSHDLENEYRTIVELARQPVSLVEVSAALGVPVAVARALVSDLAGGGYLDVHAPPATFADDRPSPDVLTRLLKGLRAR